jgi:hypothetical protein
MGKRPNTVRLRYGYNTMRISAPVNTARYGPKTVRKRHRFDRPGCAAIMLDSISTHSFNVSGYPYIFNN